MFPELKEATEEKLQELINDDRFGFERKLDGTAGLAEIMDGEVTLLGRGILEDGSQQNFTYKFPEVAQAVKDWAAKNEINQAKILGEIVCIDEQGNDIFKGIQKRANRKEDIEVYAKQYPASFAMFDLLEFEYSDITRMPFIDRKKELLMTSENVKISNTSIFTIPLETDVETKTELWNKIRPNEWEGITIKQLDSPFGEEQFKWKPTITQDVFWEGEYKPGNNRHAGRVGALLCYQYIDGKKMQVASVGGGLSDVLRDQLTFMANNGHVSPQAPRVIEVQAHELLESGKMRYPNFIRWRFDKSAAQCCRSLKNPKKIDIVEQTNTKSVVDTSIEEWL